MENLDVHPPDSTNYARQEQGKSSEEARFEDARFDRLQCDLLAPVTSRSSVSQSVLADGRRMRTD